MRFITTPAKKRCKLSQRAGSGFALTHLGLTVRSSAPAPRSGLVFSGFVGWRGALIVDVRHLDITNLSFVNNDGLHVIVLE